MNDSDLLRYSRHILLDPLGIEGQERLRNATALIVGCGGLGAPAALYLASAGVGHLVLADGDTIDLTNLQRQMLYRSVHIGQNKALVTGAVLRDVNPALRTTCLPARLSAADLSHQIGQADVVLDCSDNFSTRHAINRACVAAGKPLVSGAAIRFDGQISVFDTRQPDSPCYHCLFPDLPQAPDVEMPCAQMGVLAPLTGIIGSWQAAEALRVLSGFSAAPTGRLLIVDLLGARTQEIRVPRDPDCSVCSMRACGPAATSSGSA